MKIEFRIVVISIILFICAMMIGITMSQNNIRTQEQLKIYEQLIGKNIILTYQEHGYIRADEVLVIDIQNNYVIVKETYYEHIYTTYHINNIIGYKVIEEPTFYWQVN